MRLNWEQYNIADKPLEIILMDLTNNNWNSRIKFDAIICDPPYGIREGSKQLGSKKTNQGQSKEIKGSLKYRIPSKKAGWSRGIDTIFDPLCCKVFKYWIAVVLLATLESRI
eukprot:Anaeramoba_flamelloidesa814216_18.p2 GENE.a814216_18~~a814216_18.p2  ORF type:complete len:112 (-),score=26.57 a814216_18:200-535(-)